MENRSGMLYPMMVIAAISVILFSVIGIATMTGHIPNALSDKKDVVVAEQQAAKDAAALKEVEAAKAVREAEAAKAKELAAAKDAEAAKQVAAEKARAAKLATAATGTAAPRYVPAAQRTAAVCRDCGVVQSINTTEVKGKGTGLGVVGGAVVGGVLGHQIGSGRGQDLATVAGAVGGGYAGNEIEKRVKKTVNYVVRVRMEDGTVRSVTQSMAPGVAVGDRVRIEDGVIVSRG
ncbi:MAG: glycine zipper 2TM domain-containing protein [Burkholderiales bacterium]|nr:glycine zipper 2TM domain-containing protein [Burkholderiales bacterium]